MSNSIETSAITATPQVRKRKTTRIPITYIVAMVPIAIAIDYLGSTINGVLFLPLFLDMIGTAVVAIVLGPWWGALAGGLYNVIAALIGGPINLPFAACNIVGALIWGYGIRGGFGRNYFWYFLLNVLCGLGVTLMAVPIYVFIFGGATGGYSDLMTAAFLAMGQNLWVSVFSSNIVVSLADKIISGFIALAIIEALPANLKSHIVLPKSTSKMGMIAWIAGGFVVGVLLTIIFVLLPK
jgi:energy-coupling factor transport system substrate-specific component